MPYQAGNIVLEEWTVVDLNGDPLTGMTSPADITLTLLRQSTTTIVAASETPSWTEIGSTGRYYIGFTPLNTGRYFLHLRELNANTLLRQQRYSYDIFAAGAAYLPAFAGSFCAESDVERWAQLAFSSTSKPTSTEVAAFAEGRAAVIEAKLEAAGWSVAPSSGYTAGSKEESLLRELNAIGAAADAIIAKFLDTEPAGPGAAQAGALLTEWDKRLEAVIAYAAGSIAGAGIRTPMTAGEVTLKDELSITDLGLGETITMDKRW